MTTERLNPWDWRIPFPLGLVVGVIGFMWRRQVTELAANISSRATIRCQKIEVFSRGTVVASSLDLPLHIRTVL
jgi:hypothetical protein